ncbi:MAG: STAS-like domain-containing protein [Clostridiaceae bacterium]|nr:STAS-like domain-containing protein [Clostridiaceae bacterium]
MKDYYSDNAIRTDNIITLKYCNHPKCASDFLRLVKEVLRRGYSEIVIRSDAISVFPNACVPIAGIIDYYTQNGVNFVHDINPDSYLYKCGFMAPFKKSRKELQSEQFPFDKIFYYEDSGQVADITQAYIDANKPIDIKQLFSTIGGFDCFDIRIDNMLNDADYLVYDVFQNGKGTATRDAGAYIRLDVENILRRNQYGVILDFSNTKTVSSSFIDELVSKMVLDLGFVTFNNAIRLVNMNPEISFLCERALYMRISDTWKNQ